MDECALPRPYLAFWFGQDRFGTRASDTASEVSDPASEIAMNKGLTLRIGALAVVTLVAGGAYALFGGSETEAPAAVAMGDVVDLDWENLVPENAQVASASGVVEHEQLDDAASPWQADADVTAVRADLDGKTVRIPGYMTPLSFDEAEVGEFLLVPYVGACVHVPPPAANQIVYVKVDGTVPVLEMWEPFLAVGTLRTEPQSTELAEVGYTMQLSHLEVYEEEPFEVVDELGNVSNY